MHISRAPLSPSFSLAAIKDKKPFRIIFPGLLPLLEKKQSARFSVGFWGVSFKNILPLLMDNLVFKNETLQAINLPYDLSVAVISVTRKVEFHVAKITEVLRASASIHCYNCFSPYFCSRAITTTLTALCAWSKVPDTSSGLSDGCQGFCTVICLNHCICRRATDAVVPVALRLWWQTEQGTDEIHQKTTQKLHQQWDKHWLMLKQHLRLWKF